MMSAPAYPRNAGTDADTNFAGATATREIIASDARAIAYVAAIGVIIAAAVYARSPHFVSNVARNLRHHSEMLSQSGHQRRAIAAGRRAVDIYRTLMDADPTIEAAKRGELPHMKTEANTAG